MMADSTTSSSSSSGGGAPLIFRTAAMKKRSCWHCHHHRLLMLIILGLGIVSQTMFVLTTTQHLRHDDDDEDNNNNNNRLSHGDNYVRTIRSHRESKSRDEEDDYYSSFPYCQGLEGFLQSEPPSWSGLPSFVEFANITSSWTTTTTTTTTSSSGSATSDGHHQKLILVFGTQRVASNQLQSRFIKLHAAYHRPRRQRNNINDNDMNYYHRNSTLLSFGVFFQLFLDSEYKHFPEFLRMLWNHCSSSSSSSSMFFLDQTDANRIMNKETQRRYVLFQQYMEQWKASMMEKAEEAAANMEPSDGKEPGFEKHFRSEVTCSTMMDSNNDANQRQSLFFTSNNNSSSSTSRKTGMETLLRDTWCSLFLNKTKNPIPFLRFLKNIPLSSSSYDHPHDDNTTPTTMKKYQHHNYVVFKVFPRDLFGGGLHLKSIDSFLEDIILQVWDDPNDITVLVQWRRRFVEFYVSCSIAKSRRAWAAKQSTEADAITIQQDDYKNAVEYLYSYNRAIRDSLLRLNLTHEVIEYGNDFSDPDKQLQTMRRILRRLGLLHLIENQQDDIRPTLEMALAKSGAFIKQATVPVERQVVNWDEVMTWEWAKEPTEDWEDLTLLQGQDQASSIINHQSLSC